MKKIQRLLFAFIFTILCIQCSDETDTYEGSFISGTGDIDFLRLIDESFAFFNPNPVVPNLTMVYRPDWDTFTEGAGWGAWWIQNSYGFSYAATPFLQEPWFSCYNDPGIFTGITRVMASGEACGEEILRGYFHNWLPLMAAWAMLLHPDKLPTGRVTAM